MFDAIRRMNGGSTALTVFRMDWSKKMEAIETKLSEINSEISKAEAFYRDAALAADEGGQAEVKKRDQAFSKIDKLHRQKRDAEAAHVAAQERVERDNEKRRRDNVRQQETLITEHHRRLERHAKKIDDLIGELAEVSSEFLDCCDDLMAAGVKPRISHAAVQDFPRVIGSHFKGSRMEVGIRHPFDNEPQRFADRCPALDDVLRHRRAV